jgi:1-deoxy-D-xylulose-5-phosphate reductoisomerase
MKKVLIMGSTGSIGTQALEIIRNNKDKFRAVGLTCRSRVDGLIAQVREFSPEVVCVGNEADAARVKAEFPGIEVCYGDKGLVQIASMDCDIVLNSLMGISGLAPTYEAISRGRDIALANKETLVAGGKLVTDLCREKGVRLLPVDSEHSAIFQCLEGNGGSACGRAYRDPAEHDGRPLRRILLTASGGPFRGRSYESMKGVTVEQALNHPKWKMGSKITIDSATMMNKGLEVIEARWLFDVPAEKIDVHVHPQSIVHSMVEFMDGSVIAQMGHPDMREAIQFAFSYPFRLPLNNRKLNFAELGGMSFFAPDLDKFPALRLAYESLEKGGNMACIMNAANEAAVAAFLQERIGFYDITSVVRDCMDGVDFVADPDLDTIFATNSEAFIKAGELIDKIS